ncbi:MAG: septum formation initiator family protein [Bacteroidetes bacterium]|nr:septum formation initiator family protein [Bacteroidota bacterium]
MAKTQSTFQKYLPIIKNKYLLTFVGFLVWLTFFDRNDFITTSAYRHKLTELKAEKSHYDEEILKYKQNLNELMTDHENLEKYARENYYMKKDNEDIFVIVDESVSKKQED